MKTKIFIVILSCFLFSAMMFCYGENSNWNAIQEQLKHHNPDWNPTQKGDRYSGINSKEKGLSLSLCGPGIHDLSVISNMSFWYVGLLDVDIKNLDFIKNSSKLERLGIINAQELRDISALHNKPIRRLLIQNAPLTDISVLGELPLENLVISNISTVDISILKKSKTLISVTFSGFKSLKDIYPLAEIPTLKNIDLSDSGVEDLRPLIGKELDLLDIRNSPAVNIQIPAGLKAKKLIIK